MIHGARIVIFSKKRVGPPSGQQVRDLERSQEGSLLPLVSVHALQNHVLETNAIASAQLRKPVPRDNQDGIGQTSVRSRAVSGANQDAPEQARSPHGCVAG